MTRAAARPALRGIAPEINARRLLKRLNEMAEIGRDTSGGITRPGFSAADIAARTYLLEEARAHDLSAWVDAAGNILIRSAREPREPSSDRALVIGSHLDTVLNAGRLDGTYGVLAALEVIQALAEADSETELAVVAAAFANEEGTLFPHPFWGSKALAGRLSELPTDPRDHHGASLRDALALAGGDLDALGSAAWPAGTVAAYLELHVEQGPVLERCGKRIGVVDGITGRTVLTFQVTGVSGHAGTTPMAGRRDALAAAARVILAVESISKVHRLCRTSTVGWAAAHPNSSNTIAGTVRLIADLRDTVPERLATAEAQLHSQLGGLARSAGVEIHVVGESRSAPAVTDPALRAVIADSAKQLGLSCQLMPSGAGHDAQILAAVAPVGMIFVPSIGGVSHVPEEDTAPEDLISGAQVLLSTAARVARAV
jgi:beta-ureidopropionase / N-carbamoyl-L-amino-acid hydrolase